MRFPSAMCRLSQKVPKFRVTTALQRKLIVGALDFSPLRHSPALAEHEHYTKISSQWSRKFWQNRGKSAAQKSGTLTADI